MPLRAESPLARADLITPHGALSVQELASMSDVALGQEDAREVSRIDSTYQATSAYFLTDGRLRMYRLDSNPRGRIESLDNLSDEVFLTEIQTQEHQQQ